MTCQRDGRHCEYFHHLEKRKPPTKCYIHALHSRIALLETRLAQSGHAIENGPISLLNSGLPVDELPHSQSVSKEASHLLRNPRFTGAYGHPSFSNDYTKSQNINEPPIPSDSLLVFQPETQAGLLEEFWTWQSNWPLLVHRLLFEKDLAENGANGYTTPAVLSAVLSLGAQYFDEDQSSSWKTSADSLAQHVKGLVLGQIERPSLSLALAAALVSLRDVTVGNLASASQYIGIACRHALFLGLHLESSGDSSDFSDVKEARTLMWLGTWMLEKYSFPAVTFRRVLIDNYRHITRILGQPSAIRECDIHPFSVPNIPSLEYRPAFINPLAMTSHCMSNMQYACDLLRMVSPVIDEIYELSGSLTLQVKEDKATKAHVAMSVFYNNLPSPLRLPATSTKPLPPHVYQLNLVARVEEASCRRVMEVRLSYATTPPIQPCDGSSTKPVIAEIIYLTYGQLQRLKAFQLQSSTTALREFLERDELGIGKLEGTIPVARGSQDSEQIVLLDERPLNTFNSRYWAEYTQYPPEGESIRLEALTAKDLYDALEEERLQLGKGPPERKSM
ncbi:fungal specific transcription factor domain-containing protein [Aspergillus mulundensis]|uniref:Xylanolytic transcriptional activator regulatory domain-containing protein n=1 Tax=Aspergillus mulundensis TaxID=1810919 RepID=A0A3D8S4J1_9EURO|nr:hypothetical protein DSM5745_04745 [Aspergillus mulundensis]RDW81188.1 hypothetical protein DSM5745_04745 [Aspergillus mulundensis]